MKKIFLFLLIALSIHSFGQNKLAKTNGILIPGGFGKRGVEGKILSVQLARAKKIPFFGICFGMQISVIELARSLLGLKDSNSTELSNTKNPIVCLYSYSL